MNNIPKFTPILLGSDFNVYGMARSFYELYHQPVKAIAEKQLAPTRFTKIVDLKLVNRFSEDPYWINYMLKLKKIYKNHKEPVILIGCGDGYAELISKHKSELSDTFICPYIDFDLLNILNKKKTFYSICDKYDLPYPKTNIITKKMWESDDDIQQPFGYPVALKPSNSVEWVNIHFNGRKKAYKINSYLELKNILKLSYSNGYKSDFILQDFIPGDDSNMRVLNAYVDQYHKVKMMCLGHPLLEDPSPAAIGNYVAILPDYNKDLYLKLKTFLESIKFTGYVNFDLKYDERDQSYKIFEINLRQGRSSFFVTLNGYNLARWVVRDYVINDLKNSKLVLGNQDKSNYKLWLGVPVKIFRKYSFSNVYKTFALNLISKGDYGMTYYYSKDMNIKRWMLIKWIEHNYVKNYKLYFNKEKGVF